MLWRTGKHTQREHHGRESPKPRKSFLRWFISVRNNTSCVFNYPYTPQVGRMWCAVDNQGDAGRLALSRLVFVCCHCCAYKTNVLDSVLAECVCVSVCLSLRQDNKKFSSSGENCKLSLCRDQWTKEHSPCVSNFRGEDFVPCTGTC